MSSDIKYECILCGRVFNSKRKHKCYDGKVINYGDWDEVRECCIAGCNNFIAVEINEPTCLLHANAFDRFQDPEGE